MGSVESETTANAEISHSVVSASSCRVMGALKCLSPLLDFRAGADADVTGTAGFTVLDNRSRNFWRDFISLPKDDWLNVGLDLLTKQLSAVRFFAYLARQRKYRHVRVS